MKSSLALPLALGLGLLSSMPALAAGSDELWEVSTRADDKAGGAAGFPMPASTVRVCQRKAAGAGDMVPIEKDCKMLDQKVSGSKVSFRFECTGRMQMTGSGEVDRPDANNYSGRMQMQGNAEGRKMAMAMAFTGKRVGDCTFGDKPQIVSGPGAPGGKGGMGGMGMTPEMMQQLKNNPRAAEAMRKMYGQ